MEGLNYALILGLGRIHAIHYKDEPTQAYHMYYYLGS